MVAIRIAGLQDNCSDGIGIGLAVYFCGCSMGCKGCQNPELQDPNAGRLTGTNEIIEHLKKFKGFYDSVVLSGGEPLQQLKSVKDLLNRVDIPIIIYTGKYWGQIDDEVKIKATYIKCGPYIKSLKQEGFPASSNQHLYYHGKEVNKIGDI
jgi:anaerobic ribonucleoside-triphosphate reductase activating protein